MLYEIIKWCCHCHHTHTLTRIFKVNSQRHPPTSFLVHGVLWHRVVVPSVKRIHNLNLVEQHRLSPGSGVGDSEAQTWLLSVFTEVYYRQAERRRFRLLMGIFGGFWGGPLSAEESVEGLPRCLKLKCISLTLHISNSSPSLGF